MVIEVSSSHTNGTNALHKVTEYVFAGLKKQKSRLITDEKKTSFTSFEILVVFLEGTKSL